MVWATDSVVPQWRDVLAGRGVAGGAQGGAGGRAAGQEATSLPAGASAGDGALAAGVVRGREEREPPEGVVGAVGEQVQEGGWTAYGPSGGRMRDEEEEWMEGMRGRQWEREVEERKRQSERLREEWQRQMKTNRKLAAMMTSRQSLPMWAAKEELLDAVGRSCVTVVSGQTGCGKSTQVGWLCRQVGGATLC